MTTLPGILAVGEMMLEFSPGPMPGHFRLGYAGDTYNTAVHLARQGLEVGYLTALGTDPYSTAMLAAGSAEGVDMTGCQRIDGALPGVYLIENAPSGERQFHYWRTASPARKLFDSRHTLQSACDALAHWQVVYLSGITLAVMARPGASGFWDFIDAVAQQGKTLVVDPNYRPALWPDRAVARELYRRLLGRCDLLLPTLDDEIALWGLASAEALLDFYRRLGVAEVAMKLPGARALACRDDELVYQASRYNGEVVDTTGAGDGFNGGYLAARLAGQSLAASLAAGHRLAATVVAVAGAIPPRSATGVAPLS